MMNTTTMPHDGTFRRHPDLLHQRLDEDTIVVDARRQEVHHLNETATRVWELLASPRSIEHVLAALCDEYTGSLEDMRSTTEAFVRDLEDKGVLLHA